MAPVGVVALPGRKTIPKELGVSLVPEMLAKKTKGESPASKKTQRAVLVSLAQKMMMSKMVPVGTAALPRNKTSPTVRASKVVPETTAKKATSAEVVSKKIRKAALASLLPERTMTNKRMAVRLVPAMMAMRAASTEVANLMMTRNPMAESKAA